MDKNISLGEFKLSKEELNDINTIFIVACGTAYNAGLMGKVAIEKLARIPVEVDIASEFRYKEPLVTKRSLVITLSQMQEKQLIH